MALSESDKVLARLIKVNDTLLLHTGDEVIARSDVGILHEAVFGERTIISVWDKGFGIPIRCAAIDAVYRNGECLWERGVTPVQKSLFSLDIPPE